MKLTKKQKETIKKCWGDWEELHVECDKLLKNRLEELDFEFLKDLQKATKGAIFGMRNYWSQCLNL